MTENTRSYNATKYVGPDYLSSHDATDIIATSLVLQDPTVDGSLEDDKQLFLPLNSQGSVLTRYCIARTSFRDRPRSALTYA